jgi:hypothetical protein
LCGVALAGCGGSSSGGGGDEDVLGIVTTPDGRVLSGSAANLSQDYVGRKFPLLFLKGEDVSPQAVAEAGQGSVEVINNDKIVITLPGELPTTFDRINSTEFSDGSGEILTLEDFGAARYLYGTVGNSSTGLFASYGFETPVALRPFTARYGSTSASVVIFVPDGSPQGLLIDGGGTVDLIASFNGSGGTIQGTLFEGSEFIDFAQDGIADDEFLVRTTLNGVITEGGFAGTVDGSASLSLAGGPGPEDLNLALTNTSVDGKFFGNQANLASGTYAGDVALTPPGGPTEGGTLSGFFIAGQ